jgi:parvulin-like peptidyl-prolyl isomerase
MKSVPASEQTKQKENELRNMILDQKIAEVVLRQEAKKQKIKASKTEVQKSVDEIKKRFANDSEFIFELNKQKMSITGFEKKIAEQVEVSKLLQQNLEHLIQTPTETQARGLYDEVVATMKGTPIDNLSPEKKALVSNLAATLKRMFGEQVRVRQIFVSLPKGANQDAVRAAQEKVDTIKKELKKQPFTSVASKYSQDSVSRARDGDLGMVLKGDLIPSLDKAAFSTKVGDYTEPIKTDIGYFFLKVEEKRAKKDFTFEDVKKDFELLLTQLAATEVQNKYIEDLKSKSNIKINKTWL